MFWQKLNLIPQVFITTELWYNIGLNYTRSTRNVTLKVDFTASTETECFYTRHIFCTTLVSHLDTTFPLQVSSIRWDRYTYRSPGC